MKTYDYNKHTL